MVLSMNRKAAFKFGRSGLFYAEFRNKITENTFKRPNCWLSSVDDSFIIWSHRRKTSLITLRASIQKLDSLCRRKRKEAFLEALVYGNLLSKYLSRHAAYVVNELIQTGTKRQPESPPSAKTVVHKKASEWTQRLLL